VPVCQHLREVAWRSSHREMVVLNRHLHGRADFCANHPVAHYVVAAPGSEWGMGNVSKIRAVVVRGWGESRANSEPNMVGSRPTHRVRTHL